MGRSTIPPALGGHLRGWGKLERWGEMERFKKTAIGKWFSIGLVWNLVDGPPTLPLRFGANLSVIGSYDSTMWGKLEHLPETAVYSWFTV